MLYRCIRKKDTGEWVDVLFTVAEGQFTVLESSHQESIADALGLLPSALETVEENTDQRTGVMLSLPIAAPTPETLEKNSFIAVANIDPERLTNSQIQDLLSYVAKKVLNV